MRRVTLLVVLVLAACSTSEQVTLPETTTTAPETTTTTTLTTTTVEDTTTTVADTTTTVAAPTPTLQITIAAFRFSGDESGVVGDTVSVVNTDSVGHTWTSTDGVFHSGVLSGGDTFSFTFEQAGTFAFVCQIHPDMSGSITIEG